MKKIARSCFAIALVLILSLAVAQPAAFAAGAQVTPLDETNAGDWYFGLPMKQIDLDLSLPMNAQYEHLQMQEGVELVQIMLPACPDVYYGFFAIHNLNAEGVALDALTKEELANFLRIISPRPELLETEVLPDGIAGYPAVLAKEWIEKDSFYSEHLVVIYGEWVLNMMVQRPDGKQAFTAEESMMQKGLLAMTLEMKAKKKTSYQLPGTNMVFALPDGAEMTMDYDEDDYKSLYVRQADVLTTLTLYAFRNQALWGIGIDSLDENMRFNLMDFVSIGDPVMDSMRYETLPDTSGTMLFFDSDERQEKPSRHLMAVHDGWVICASYFPQPEFDEEWALAAQRTLIETALRAEVDTSVKRVHQEGNDVYLPLMTGDAVAALPEGYVLYSVEDNATDKQVLLYADNQRAYYLIMAAEYAQSAGMTQTEYFTEEEIVVTGKGLAANLSGTVGSAAEYAVLETGPLNVPCVSAISENGMGQAYLVLFDSYSIVMLGLSDEVPLTEAEIDQLANLLTFIPWE